MDKSIMKKDFGFIFTHWDAINFFVIGLAIIAIALVLFSKESVKTKIINILIISFLPLVGSLFYFGRILFWYRKKKLNQSAK